jgi:rhomboid protease GluP
MNSDIKREFRRQGVNLVLIGLMVFLYLLTAAGSQSFTISNVMLYAFGAEQPLAIWQGEWWRLLTAGFLHASFTHIFMNLLVMYYIGRLVEQELGHWQYAVLFVMSVITGNIIGLFSTGAQDISIGASGGVFGLFGAILMLGLLDRRRAFWQNEAKVIVLLVVWSLVSSIFQSGVDIGAHIGGALGGFVLTPALLDGYHVNGAFKLTATQRLLSLAAFMLLVIVLFWLAYKF